jgi:2Fe-2S ferredoxin
VYVTQGGNTCQPATDDEEDMLDTARAVTPESRLSCQCIPNGSGEVRVVIPAWNKNLAKEGH